jgi:hypothetical protein
MIAIRNTNPETALVQMIQLPDPQQTLTLLCLHGPDRKDLPPRGLEDLHQTIRKTLVEIAHLASHTSRSSQVRSYLAPSYIAPIQSKDLSRCYCVSPNGLSRKFGTLADSL